MELPSFLKETPIRNDAAPAQNPRPRVFGQYSLADVLVVTALFGAALASFQLSVLFGILALIVMAAAIIRTVIVESLRASNPDMGVSSSLGLEVCLSAILISFATACGFLMFLGGGMVAVALPPASTGRPMDFPPLWPIAIGFVLACAITALVLWVTRNIPSHF